MSASDGRTTDLVEAPPNERKAREAIRKETGDAAQSRPRFSCESRAPGEYHWQLIVGFGHSAPGP
jgi:hypothetical protein